MPSILSHVCIFAILTFASSRAHPHNDRRLSSIPTTVQPHPIRAQLAAQPSVSLVSPNSTITADPIAFDRPDTTSLQDHIHIIVAAVLALVLITACFLIIRYLERMPFQRLRRQPPGATTAVPAPPGLEADTGAEGMRRVQWMALGGAESSGSDTRSLAGTLPEKPPAVYLREKLPLSPIEGAMPMLKCMSTDSSGSSSEGDTGA
ncbi:hypothetical protein FA95DRAFT_573497 [Auriscalpium vulgare]|uniref:Uncharacterized protein n=1 Tax=Auriscalpium vulgare TaxID=40419 RepID=A0ACB8S279_9AGAM|nr:hypothetical protein FA95DRAFT_573497 [Auriscalpium vulgare]